jgi:hypothetical protein
LKKPKSNHKINVSTIIRIKIFNRIQSEIWTVTITFLLLILQTKFFWSTSVFRLWLFQSRASFINVLSELKWLILVSIFWFLDIERIYIKKYHAVLQKYKFLYYQFCQSEMGSNNLPVELPTNNSYCLPLSLIKVFSNIARISPLLPPPEITSAS